MLTAIIVLTSLTQILLSLFVLFKGRKNLSYFLFFLIGLSSLGWAISNYLTTVYLNSPDVLYIIRVILLFVVLQNTFFCMFTRYFPKKTWDGNGRWLYSYVLLTAITAVVVLTPFVFVSAEVKEGIALTKAAPGILLFIVHAAYSIILGFRWLIRKAKNTSGREKNQLILLIIASVLNWIVVPITNFALTPLLKSTFFITFSPIYTLLFASLIAYAIVAQRLFDIRLIVARSVVYVFSMGILALSYATISSFLVNGLLSQASSLSINIATNTVIFLIAVVIFPYLKVFFDKTTRKLFFRDSYDSQQVLDKISNTIVSEIHLHEILKNVTFDIVNATKSVYIDFLLHHGDSDPLLITRHKHGQTDNPKSIITRLHDYKYDEIVTDELPSSDLQEFLAKNDIALSIRLKTHRQVVGYMLMGEKKSGNIFTKQDRALLSIAANELAVAIQNALRFEEIQGFAETLEVRVKEATYKLQASNRKLKEMDETKDDFISMASHQLRTPLTSVKGYLSMVIEGDAGKLTAMQKKLLNQAFISSQRMVFLIADLLNVSRLKTGKFIIETKPTNLANIVQEEIGQLTETAAGRGLELSFKKPSSFPSLMLDETKIRQVIMNFIDNAIYYTPAGGKVEVILGETEASVELKVVDNGIGVPKAEQHNLFNKFYRAGNARKARPDGTGLGLFMAKKVIVAQGGAIIFDSHEDKGSIFGFNFPKQRLLVTQSNETMSHSTA